MRISQVTWLRSELLSTRKISLGSDHSFQYFVTVSNSALPFICIAPSPVHAMTSSVRKGKLRGDSVRNGGAHRCQAARERGFHAAPHSNVAREPVRRRASVAGKDRVARQPLVQLPEYQLRIDRIALDMAARLLVGVPLLEILGDLLAPGVSAFRLEQRQEAPQASRALSPIRLTSVGKRKTDVARIDVDLNAASMRLALGRNSEYG